MRHRSVHVADLQQADLSEAAWAAVRRRLTDGSENLLEEARQELDRVLLPLVMERTRGNQCEAARVLGVARLTLRRRLRELNIAPRFALAAVG